MKWPWATFKKIRWSIIIVLSLISVIGFIVLFSAANGHIEPWAKKQLLRYMIALQVLVVVAHIDLRIWIGLSYLLYCLSLLLLVAVEIMGKIGMGAQRWINLYLFPIQPSELMKVTLLMALARHFHLLSFKDLMRTSSLIVPLILISLPVILVLRQPDLGTAALIIGASLTVCFVSGIQVWKILTLLGSITSSIPILWSCLHSYQKQRILTFLFPDQDSLGTGYHILQSKIALSSGGLLGKGFGNGSQSHLNFLPEKQTDFIFAMFCEEFGVVGGLFLLTLYTILLVYGFQISRKSRSSYGRLLGIGLSTLFFLYVFVNIGMVMGLLPVVGIPLPLVSYGGTALLTIMIAFGLLISIDFNRNQRLGQRT